MANRSEVGLQRAIQHWNVNAQRPVVLVIAGRQGAGKSTLVNNFLGLRGERKAKARASVRAVTHEIRKHEEVVNGITVRIIDSPGLEATDETDSEEKVSLAMLSEYTGGKADLLLYFVSLKEGRFDVEKHIKIITKLNKTFTSKIWERTLLVLTHADVVVEDDDDDEPELSALVGEYCTEFLKVLVKSGVGPSVVADVQCVPPPEMDQSTHVHRSTMLAVPVGKRLGNPHGWKISMIKAVLKKCDIDAIPAMLELQGVRWQEMKYELTTNAAQYTGLLGGVAIGEAVGGEFGRMVGTHVGRVVGAHVASHLGDKCDYARIIDARRRVEKIRYSETRES